MHRLDDHRRLGFGIGALRELHWVDDQNDFAGAEHGSARDAGDASELRADVLDDDFLIADHFVDVHGGDALAALKQQYRVVAQGLWIVPGIAEQAWQIEERILAVLPHDFPREIQVDQGLVLDLLDLLDHRRRQGPQPTCRPYQHGLRNRQCQRQIEQERRAATARGRDIDAAAQRRNVRAHNIGAHAAA